MLVLGFIHLHRSITSLRRWCITHPCVMCIMRRVHIMGIAITSIAAMAGAMRVTMKTHGTSRAVSMAMGAVVGAGITKVIRALHFQ